jgi:hypothetical protein
MNKLVRDGYDRIAEAYAAQRDKFLSLPYLSRFAGEATCRRARS